MARSSSRIRLYIDHPLGARERVSLSRDQAHYLFSVMRLEVGDAVSLFNGTDGEWRAVVAEAGKKGGGLACEAQTAPLVMPPDIWLMMAAIRKERMGFVVEKAVELGTARIALMQTEYTQDAKRVRLDKLNATALEAAEQCGATFVPPVDDVAKLDTLLDGWNRKRRILFCDETMAGESAALPTDAGPDVGPWAIFIGPEGGFSPKEREQLRAMPCAHPISLGPRILRAETAAISALTLWQHALGDWR